MQNLNVIHLAKKMARLLEKFQGHRFWSVKFLNLPADGVGSRGIIYKYGLN